MTKIICIPGSVKKLTWTFDGYTGLEKMPQIGYGVEDMTGTFSGCSELNKISALPDTVKTLENTFTNCSNLQEVPNIPNDVTNMRQTFWLCTGLGKIEITIPEKVTDIHQTFGGCTNLEGKITINCNPEDYGNFLHNTTKQIILTGKSTMLNQIAEGRSNITVIY